jgi:hypothetical protein
MNKFTNFDDLPRSGWPAVRQLEPYFLAPKGKEWFYTGGNDTAGFRAEGLEGTDNMEPYKDRIDVHLSMWGNPNHGVLLIYHKYGGDYKEMYTSKGDLSRLGELVRSLHDDLMPVGLFIPFREAWKAVKEFIETDGALPKSIEWIANKDLPPNTFPDP